MGHIADEIDDVSSTLSIFKLIKSFLPFQCMDPDDILSLLKLDPSSKSLSRSSAQDVAVFLSHQILYFESMCVSGKKGCNDIRDCQEDVLKVMGRYSSPRESLLNILRMFKMYLKEEAGKEVRYS